LSEDRELGRGRACWGGCEGCLGGVGEDGWDLGLVVGVLCLLVLVLVLILVRVLVLVCVLVLVLVLVLVWV
jgi:hypothetical protein